MHYGRYDNARQMHLGQQGLTTIVIHKGNQGDRGLCKPPSADSSTRWLAWALFSSSPVEQRIVRGQSATSSTRPLRRPIATTAWHPINEKKASLPSIKEGRTRTNERTVGTNSYHISWTEFYYYSQRVEEMCERHSQALPKPASP
jgi:hypothetical protein